MSNPSNGMFESPSRSQTIASEKIPVTRRIYWVLRRELWENRSIYIAPIGVATLFLFGFVISTVHLPAQMRAAAALLDPVKRHQVIATPYDIAAGLLMLTAMIVGVFYSLDALYGERRDRSTLFWKSMPVSDRMTVLTKASIPLILLPLLAFAITMIMQLMMLMLSSAVLAGSGQSMAALWTELSFGRMSMLLLYHWLTVHMLWHWPIYAWLLLVSAWSGRAPVLWALMPPIAICFLERIAFNTTYLTTLLRERLAGSGMEALTVSGTFPMDPMTHLTPGRFLSAPGLWIGLVVTAFFLAAAVRLRRSRGPI